MWSTIHCVTISLCEFYCQPLYQGLLGWRRRKFMASKNKFLSLLSKKIGLFIAWLFFFFFTPLELEFLFSKWKMNLTSLGTSRLFIRYFLVQFYGFPLTFKLQKKVGKRAQHGYKLALKQKDFLLALINGKPYIFLLRRFDGFGISFPLRSWAKARSIVNFRTAGPSPYCNT